VHALVLRHPDYNRPFILYTRSDYSSKVGMGAVLVQRGLAGEEYVVAYASRRTSEAEQKLGASEGELMAAIWACEKFIDHAALAHLKKSRVTGNSKLVRWSCLRL
jgi:hypothetical protein